MLVRECKNMVKMVIAAFQSIDVTTPENFVRTTSAMLNISFSCFPPRIRFTAKRPVEKQQ